MWLYFLIALIVIIVIYVAFTYVSIKRQQKKFVEMQQSIAPNKEVIIAGGIYGRIKHLDNVYAKIEIAEGVVVKVERFAIKQVL